MTYSFRRFIKATIPLPIRIAGHTVANFGGWAFRRLRRALRLFLRMVRGALPTLPIALIWTVIAFVMRTVWGEPITFRSSLKYLAWAFVLLTALKVWLIEGMLLEDFGRRTRRRR